MAIAFDITSAQLVGLFIECTLYGVYLVTFGFCLRALLFQTSEKGLYYPRRKNINWIMLIVALLLCLFATLDVAFNLKHNLDAFVYYTGPGGATEELENISYWVNVMQTVDCIAQVIIGDGMLIYRCYIVFGRDWKVIVPSVVLFLGFTVCGALLIWTFATLNSAALLGTSHALPYFDTMIPISLTINTVNTALIIWRIRSVDRENAVLMTDPTSGAARTSKLHRVMRIIIDSAALYTIGALIFSITYFVGSNATYVTSDNLIQIIGISFNLIIIRVDANRSSEGSIAKNIASNDMPPFHPRAQTRQQRSFPLSLFQTNSPENELATAKGITFDVEVVRDYGNSRESIQHV